MVSAPVQQQKLRLVKSPPQPQLKQGEILIFPEYCEPLNGQYFKEFVKIADRYRLLGMTMRMYDYARVVMKIQQGRGPKLVWASIETIAEKMGRSYFTTYEVRRELIEGGFLIIRTSWDKEGKRQYYMHDFTPFFLMCIGLDNDDLYEEAATLAELKREYRSELGRRAATKSTSVSLVEAVNETYAQQNANDKETLRSYQKELNLRLLKQGRIGSTSSTENVTTPGNSLRTSLATTQENLESKELDYLPKIDISNLSKPLNEEVFGDTLSPDDYTNPPSFHNQTSYDSSSKSKSSETENSVETNTYPYSNEQRTNVLASLSSSDRNTQNRNIENLPSKETGAARQASRETKYKSLVALHGRAEAQSLPDVFKTYIEDFSRDLGDEAPKSTLTQVATIYAPLGAQHITADSFVQLLYDARNSAHKASIERMTKDGRRMKRIGYFIELLADSALKTLDMWREEDKDKQGDPYSE